MTFLLGKYDVSSNLDNIDKNLVRSLASFYGKAVGIVNLEFENYLQDYFKAHYQVLISDKSQEFLTDFSRCSDDNYEGDLFKIARQFDIDTSVFGDNFGTNLLIKDGLIYENTPAGLNVIYATDKAICGIVGDLYGSSLYYKHLATENTILSNANHDLQNEFIAYANENEISLDGLPDTVTGNQAKSIEDNVIDFKQSV